MGNHDWDAIGGRPTVNPLIRGAIACLVVAATWGGLVANALAGSESDGYPNKTITIVVPFGPGATDQMASVIGRSISEITSRPVSRCLS